MRVVTGSAKTAVLYRLPQVKHQMTLAPWKRPTKRFSTLKNSRKSISYPHENACHDILHLYPVTQRFSSLDKQRVTQNYLMRRKPQETVALDSFVRKSEQCSGELQFVPAQSSLACNSNQFLFLCSSHSFVIKLHLHLQNEKMEIYKCRVNFDRSLKFQLKFKSFLSRLRTVFLLNTALRFNMKT